MRNNNQNRITVVKLWDTRNLKTVKKEFGFISPVFENKGEIKTIRDIKRLLVNDKPLIDLYEIDRVRTALKTVFEVKKPIPEINKLNLKGYIIIKESENIDDINQKQDNLDIKNVNTETEIIEITKHGLKVKALRLLRLSIIETISIDKHACYNQRLLFPYQSKIYGSLSWKTRQGIEYERATPTLNKLSIEKGKFYITFRCAICGFQKRITLGKKNKGRNNLICSKCKTETFIQSIKRGKDILYSFEIYNTLYTKTVKRVIPKVKTDKHGLPKKAISKVDFKQYLRRL